jgi:hypothetical protein
MITSKSKILAGTRLPEDGIFWFIKGKWIVYSDQVSARKQAIQIGGYLHSETWKAIACDYIVNGQEVDYDYFPRGRVVVTSRFNECNEFTHFDCKVYGDSCILDNEEFRDEIEDHFKLYLSTCKVEFVGQFFTDGSHYTCHQCR